MSGAVTPDGWSAYDEAVPQPRDLPDVVAKAAELRALRRPPEGGSLADVRRVVVVVSSSRGGSSLFGQVLRGVPGLLHLRAEVNPLFTLAGLHGGPDRRRVLEAELLRDIGAPGLPVLSTARDRSRLVVDLAWRLTAQWPLVVGPMPLEKLLAHVDEAVPPVGACYDATATHLCLLGALRDAGLPVHPGYYDLPRHGVPARWGAPSGPPGGAVVEMPPFVTVGPWRPATVRQLRSEPLVVCTPRSSFRLELLRDLFPAADLRVVHLTRNPAASVNGLVDGWLHHGFFNTVVPGRLAIEGYSDVVPGGRAWWCYDFPPGWERWTSASLPEVAAFQWRATHAAALDGARRLGVRPLRLRFEDVVGTEQQRLEVSADLAELLELPAAGLQEAMTAELPVVMATERPVPGRWRARRPHLRGVLEDPAVLELADRLGYGTDPAAWV